jgi:hypothetical protein
MDPVAWMPPRAARTAQPVATLDTAVAESRALPGARAVARMQPGEPRLVAPSERGAASGRAVGLRRGVALRQVAASARAVRAPPVPAA